MSTRTDDPLPVPASLPDAARAAAARGEPLVVMVTLKGCAFCDVVRRSHLLPMLRRGEVVAVQVDMLDRQTPIVGFDQRPTTGQALARQWRIGVAPTLLFVDAQGRELAERMEGMGLADFYGPYLEERLRQARQRLAPREVGTPRGAAQTPPSSPNTAAHTRARPARLAS